MSKRLILILALAFVVGIACSAYAEVQNVKISGDLGVQSVSRNNILLRKSDEPPDFDPIIDTFTDYDHRISAILSQVRVRVDADLTDNVSATVRLLNERVWDEEGTSNTDIDLDLAYVSVKEFLYSPLSLTVGRQELMFGNGLVIGDVDTNGICAGHTSSSGSVTTERARAGSILPKSLDDLSVRKAFDAVRATLDYDPLVIDAIYAKVDENLIDHKDDVNLYGVNANYALDNATTIEGYYWEKRREKQAGASGDSTPGGTTGLQSRDDITRTLGARVGYTGIENLLLSLEGAWQFGKHIRSQVLYPDEASDDQGARRREGYAIQVISQYSLSDLIANYEPVLGASYTLLSGDPYKSVDKRFRGWDAMFENQAGGTIFNKILGYSNCQMVNVSGSMKPIEDVKLALDYYYLRLIKPYRAEVGNIEAVTLSGILGDPTYQMIAGKKELGSELDATLTYDYTEDVQLGLSMGWFFPGDAFGTENDRTASQVIGSMKVTF